MLLNSILKDYPVYIVDIGASGGIHPRWSKFAMEIKAILFEPDPREYEILKANAPDKFIVLNAALSDCRKEVDFNLCKKQQVSSVYMPNLKFLSKFPESERFEVVKTIKIPTDTLDHQLSINNIMDIDFIKIDTQGHELAILNGAENALKNTIGLDIEVEFAQLYIDQPLFTEVNQYIEEQGFELFDLRRHYWKRQGNKAFNSDRKGQIVFGDALYFKTPEALCAVPELSEQKILHAVLIYLVYGYTELAVELCNIAYENKLLSDDLYSSIILFLRDVVKKDIIPRFKGRGTVCELLDKMANVLSLKEWHTGDRTLGM